jgi:lysophospholipase L1-like esterase
MNIIFITDSLMMLREWDNISLEDSYGYLLYQHYLKEKKEWNIILRPMRLNHTVCQAHPDHLVYDVKLARPDIVFIHLGIVDCAPRLFYQIEDILINRLSTSMKENLLTFFSKRRLFFTKHFPKVYVPIKDFEYYYEVILKAIVELNAVPVIINIAKTNKRNESRSYNFQKNIQDYNAVLLKLSKKYKCPLIDVYKETEKNEKYLLPEGIHLSKLGNKRMTQIIIDRIEQITKKE